MPDPSVETLLSVLSASPAKTIVNLPSGEIVLREGEHDDLFHVIMEGTANVSKGGVVLGSVMKGDALGLGSIVDDCPHSASVTATSPLVLLRLNKNDFQALISSNPALSAYLLKQTLSELRSYRSQFLEVLPSATKSAPPRDRIVFFDFKAYEKATFESEFEKLKDAGWEVKYFEERLGEDTASLAKGAKVVCLFVNDSATAAVLHQLASQGTQLLALRCAGFNNVHLPTASALELSVVRVPAYSPYAVAEHAVAMLMSLNRKIPQSYNRARTGNFSLKGLVGFDVHGKTVGVIGTGKIGQCFIKIMQGFGCKVVAYDAFPSSDVATWANVTYVSLETLFATSHIISIHCPLKAETTHLIDRPALEKMKKGVIIINTSRGAIVDANSLIWGLKSAIVGGAGLDVYEQEREYFFRDRSEDVTITDDTLARLMTFSNVLVTSHQAFLTTEALCAIASTTVNNMKEFLVDGKNGKDLTNAVSQ